jgi:hypothetical protein
MKTANKLIRFLCFKFPNLLGRFTLCFRDKKGCKTKCAYIGKCHYFN